VPEILFIADLHLDGTRPRLIELFIQFLRDRARHAAALYILGDLYEYWIGDDAPAAALRPTMAALAELHRSGVAVFFLHGNRDFLIDRGFARETGCQLLPEAVVIDLFGQPTLIMHGDTLCTDDQAYQAFRARIRNPVVRRILLSLSVRMRQRIARGLRDQSRRAIGDKTPEIMDVNPQAVEAAMRKHGVRRLIHGHTHRPAVHEFEIDGAPATRIVLGDWYEQGSVLCCTRRGCELTGIDVPPGAAKLSVQTTTP
jgi:UDP-2,3-diacylglucosamine hydrolase